MFKIALRTLHVEEQGYSLGSFHILFQLSIIHRAYCEVELKLVQECGVELESSFKLQLHLGRVYPQIYSHPPDCYNQNIIL